VPESGLACDDGDPCTVEVPEAGSCTSQAVPGRPGARCRLAALAAFVDRLAPGVVGGERLRARLRHRITVATRLLEGPRAKRRTVRARRQIRKLLASIARGARHGRTPPSVADVIRALGESALARLADQNS
jgi:hypothetical protein